MGSRPPEYESVTLPSQWDLIDRDTPQETRQLAGKRKCGRSVKGIVHNLSASPITQWTIACGQNKG